MDEGRGKRKKKSKERKGKRKLGRGGRIKAREKENEVQNLPLSHPLSVSQCVRLSPSPLASASCRRTVKALRSSPL